MAYVWLVDGTTVDKLFQQLENVSMDSMVDEALRAIWDGATPDSLEGQHLDFKEDPARSVRPAANPDAQRTKVLLDTAICFANADGVSHIVLGVRDKARGEDAFTGTDADPEQLQAAIFNRTQPNLTVEASAETFRGHRLVVVRIPQGLALYTRKDGSASIRHGDRCEPLDEQSRHELSFRRLNPDFTARPTMLHVEDADPLALAEALHRFNRQHPEERVSTPRDLLQRLGLLADGEHLTRAGALLVAPPQAGEVYAQHLWRSTPGGEPERNDVAAPLLLAIPEMLHRIRARSNGEVDRVELPTGQERAIRDFPDSAVDEVVLNAFVHRDWGVAQSIIVEQSPRVLSVVSPGGLPVSVQRDRLLTTTSRPRNHALMRALRLLGLVEESSRGFDRMWKAMLTSGRQAPEVGVDDYSVTVTFAAGGVDERFIQVLALLPGTVGEEAAGDLNALLVLKELSTVSVIAEETAGRLFQMGRLACRESLAWLVQVGVLAEVGTGLWTLSDDVRRLFQQVGFQLPGTADIRGWILEAVRDGGTVTNREIARATDTPARTVTQVLGQMASLGLIYKDPDGPSRGPAVRWLAR